jgi:ketosteroid isomerase-like protein
VSSRSGTAVTYAEVAEGIRRAQATYARSLDGGRIDDLAAVFTEDGVVDIEGMDAIVGREAIRATYEGWKPRSPQRHLVANLHVTEWNEREATATTDVVLVQLRDGAWVITFVARYTDVVRNEDGVWRFARRTTRFAAAGEDR